MYLVLNYIEKINKLLFQLSKHNCKISNATLPYLYIIVFNFLIKYNSFISEVNMNVNLLINKIPFTHRCANLCQQLRLASQDRN